MQDRDTQPQANPKPQPERARPLPLADRRRLVRQIDPINAKPFVFTDWAAI